MCVQINSCKHLAFLKLLKSQKATFARIVSGAVGAGKVCLPAKDAASHFAVISQSTSTRATTPLIAVTQLPYRPGAMKIGVAAMLISKERIGGIYQLSCTFSIRLLSSKLLGFGLE